MSFVLLHKWGCILILAATGFIKLISAAGSSPVLLNHDPLLMLDYRTLMLSIGMAEIGVAIALILGRDTGKAFLAVVWLSGGFLSYQMGLFMIGAKEPCPCLGTLYDILPAFRSVAASLVKASAAYMFIGSLICLWQMQRGKAFGMDTVSNSEFDNDKASST